MIILTRLKPNTVSHPSYASRHITVLDQPTMIKEQLWVPWRRDVDQLESIINMYQHCQVIFGHFDIIDCLNATHTSTEGLRPSLFPSHVPVYTGHYHTPQVHGNIRYLPAVSIITVRG